MAVQSQDAKIPTNWVKLLSDYFNHEYFTPEYWEPGKKSRNFFARISQGRKTMFTRKFLQSTFLDGEIVFRGASFAEDAIIEQKAVFIKGAKQEVTFHGFFIIHHGPGGIYGEKISQREALEYFQAKTLLPTPKSSNTPKNALRVKIGTVIRQLAQMHGDDVIEEILIDILEEYFPKPTKFT